MEKTAKPSDENIRCSGSENLCQYQAELESLRQQVNMLAEQVRTDALTGLFNYRFFSETIELEMERTRRGAQPLSMIMLDIDHFKQFNDQWGHELGNAALVHIAHLIKVAVRKLDFPCRFGGEEFVILLPNTDLRQAIFVAERLREMIALSVLEHQGQQIHITASLGVDQFSSRESETSEAFKQRVDGWLYQAKHQGRNRVAYPDQDMITEAASVTTEEKDALFNLLGGDA